MQISRHLLLACAVATYLTPTLAHAYDNESQIRARQALEEKMNQMGVQAPETNHAPAAVAPKPETKAAPKHAAKPNPPVVRAAPAVRTGSAEDQKLREALREKMSEQPAVSAAPGEAPAPAVQPKATAKNPPPQAAPAPAMTQPAPATSAEDEKLREALREKMNEQQTVSTPSNETPAAKPNAAAENPAPAAAMTQPATSPEDEKLREALHDRMSQQQAISTNPKEAPAMPTVQPKEPGKTPPAMAKTPPVYEQNPAAMTPTPAAKPSPEPVPAQAPTATYSPMPAPSNVQRPELPSMPTPTPAPAPTAKNPAQPAITLPPLSGPPSSLSPAKQQKLDVLLQQYRADQISPEQYHEQRAKILSEP